MDIFNIYMAGGMSNLSFEEQVKWRYQIKNAILYEGYELACKPCFFIPPDYYNFEEPCHKSEREVLEYDLNALRKSDLVIVNFNDPRSIGTAIELAVAYENRIPVVGILKDNENIHPWLAECTTRMCDSMRELVDYVVDFYLK